MKNYQFFRTRNQLNANYLNFFSFSQGYKNSDLSLFPFLPYRSCLFKAIEWPGAWQFEATRRSREKRSGLPQIAKCRGHSKKLPRTNVRGPEAPLRGGWQFGLGSVAVRVFFLWPGKNEPTNTL